jgi:hypothetical protein
VRATRYVAHLKTCAWRCIDQQAFVVGYVVLMGLMLREHSRNEGEALAYAHGNRAKTMNGPVRELVGCYRSVQPRSQTGLPLAEIR